MSSLPEGYKRLKEGIERFFITDINNPAANAQAQSTIPVIKGSWADTGIGFALAISGFNHVLVGSNVPYMEGHVKFIRYKAKLPVANSQPGTPGEGLSTWMSGA